MTLRARNSLVIAVAMPMLSIDACRRDEPSTGPERRSDGELREMREVKDMVKMRGVPEFWVGSRAFPSHRKVTIDAFYIAPCETTQALYTAVMKTNPSVGKQGPLYPVQNVSWEDTARFCNELSRKLGFDPCYDERHNFACNVRRNGFRLPLSSEWEYACRGDNTSPYFWGDSKTSECCVVPLTYNAFKRLANPLNVSFSEEVMSRRPNQFGLYDMAGNVTEWCQDVFPDSPGFRVYRGGSWEHYDWEAFQCKWSSGMPQDVAVSSVGFRIVRRAE